MTLTASTRPSWPGRRASRTRSPEPGAPCSSPARRRMDAAGRIVPGGIVAQFEQALANLLDRAARGRRRARAAGQPDRLHRRRRRLPRPRRARSARSGGAWSAATTRRWPASASPGSGTPTPWSSCRASRCCRPARADHGADPAECPRHTRPGQVPAHGSAPVSARRTRSAATTCRRRSSGRDLLFDLPELRYPERLNCAAALLDRPRTGRPPLPARPRRRPGRYGELRAHAPTRSPHVLTDDLGLVPGNRVLLRGPNNPWLVACWLGRAQGRRRRGGHDAAAAPGRAAPRSARSPSPASPSATPGSPTTSAAELPDLPIGVLRRRADADLTGRGAACRHRSPTSTPPPTTSRCSPSPPAPPAARRRPCTSTATCSPSPTPSAGTWSGPAADDVFTGTPPLAFTFGLGGLVVFPLRAGASTLLLEQATPAQLAEAVAEHGVTVLFTAPTAYRAMLAAGSGRPAGRPCAARSRPASTCRARSGRRSTTRTGLADHRRHRLAPRCCTSSSPRPTTTSARARPAGRCPATGRRCWTTTATRCRTARRAGSRSGARPAAATSPTRGSAVYVQHGWNITGDTYVRDADGYFWYQARSDDMIISSGYNIAGPEVEHALLSIPDVRRVRGGRPARTPTAGSSCTRTSCCATGVAGDAAKVAELQDFVKQQIAPYKYPRLGRVRSPSCPAPPPASCSGSGCAQPRHGRGVSRCASRSSAAARAGCTSRALRQGSARPGSEIDRLGAQRARRHVRLRRGVLRRDPRRHRARRPGGLRARWQREFARWDDIDVHFRGTRLTITSGGHGFAAMSRKDAAAASCRTRCARARRAAATSAREAPDLDDAAPGATTW